MTFESLQDNLKHMKKIVRELFVFTNQLDIIENLETDKNFVIDTQEKKLLRDAISALTNQLRILNNSIPDLVQGIGFYKGLMSEGKPEIHRMDYPRAAKIEKMVQVKYTPESEREKISVVIDDKSRKDFLENLNKSNLSIRKLKDRYAAEPSPALIVGKPSKYAKISNRIFRKISNSIISKGYFERLNRDLRKISSPFVLGTYVSMILMTIFTAFIASLFLFVLLLFVDVSLSYPFFSFVEELIWLRAVKIFWIIFVIPFLSGLIFYFYPYTESQNLGARINQELPFIAIHMSAIATSGVEPLSIFKIILRGEEYKYSNIEFRKIMNLVNFHGKNLVAALKEVAFTSPSPKLRELLNGIATTSTSGGNLSDFLNKHSESLLFDYRLERERYTRTSETFMDIYIAVVIAAPMILLMLFVIMGSTGTLGNFLGLSTNILSFLIILTIVLLNIIFLAFLKMKQPAI